MRVREIAHVIESWAPRWAAWEKDNVGLQVGNPEQRVSGVLIALEATQEVVREAIARKANCIVTHHPLLFRPPRRLSAAERPGRLLMDLVRHDISVYSAHTNLDYARDGVSFILAERLGLRRVTFLSPLDATLVKLVVFVPAAAVERVSEAMAAAGGGKIGEYDSCSFRAPGTGTFRGSSRSHPAVGKSGRRETVDEIRLEMIAPRAAVPDVVAAIKRTHPYEEAAYDIYPLENPSIDFGVGAVGNLDRPVTLDSFLRKVKRELGAERVRFCGQPGQKVQRIAVCGGSGGDHIADAIRSGADAFVTADIRYHSFLDSLGDIALIDAGHWETEHLVLDTLARRLRLASRGRHGTFRIDITKHRTNPIHFV